MNRDYVAVWAASQVLGRNHRTIRTWVHRRQVAAMRDSRTGQLLVHRGDVVREHERAGLRRRAK